MEIKLLKERYSQLIADRLTELDHEDKMGESAQDTVTLDQQSVGRLSRMDALQQQAMAKATQTRRDTIRKRLQAALERLETDDFGYCEECGEEIAPARLELDPGVTRCISCASA